MGSGRVDKLRVYRGVLDMSVPVLLPPLVWIDRLVPNGGCREVGEEGGEIAEVGTPSRMLLPYYLWVAPKTPSHSSGGGVFW